MAISETVIFIGTLNQMTKNQRWQVSPSMRFHTDSLAKYCHVIIRMKEAWGTSFRRLSLTEWSLDPEGPEPIAQPSTYVPETPEFGSYHWRLQALASNLPNYHPYIAAITDRIKTSDCVPFKFQFSTFLMLQRFREKNEITIFIYFSKS